MFIHSSFRFSLKMERQHFSNNVPVLGTQIKEHKVVAPVHNKTRPKIASTSISTHAGATCRPKEVMAVRYVSRVYNTSTIFPRLDSKHEISGTFQKYWIKFKQIYNCFFKNGIISQVHEVLDYAVFQCMGEPLWIIEG